MQQNLFYQFPKLSDAKKQILYEISQFNKQEDLKQIIQLVEAISDQKLSAFKQALNPNFLKIAQKIPQMAQLALEFLENPPSKVLLVQEGNIEFTRKEIYQILSLSFFGLLEPQKQGRSFPYPCNMTLILETQPEKTKCLLHYFLNAQLTQEIVTIERVQLSDKHHGKFIQIQNGQILWENSQQPLSQIEFSEELIEKHSDSIIVDFANKYIGGGVLSHGCVQEEILFMIMPENLISVIFCSVLKANEIVLTSNAIKYSSYTGYAKNFAFKPQEPQNLNQVVLVLDALNFGHYSAVQFERKNIERELLKAFTGFALSDNSFQKNYQRKISTGKWGCGAFSGDVELKIIIQLLAFSAANPNKDRKLVFSTFKDDKANYYKNQVNEIIQKYQTIGSLFSKISSGLKGNVLKALLK